MGQLRRTARRLGGEISELAKIRTTEGIVTRRTGGVVHVQREGQTTEDARPYIPVGDVVPGQRVRLLGDLAIALGGPLSASGEYKVVQADYNARPNYWNVVVWETVSLVFPASLQTTHRAFHVVPADDGKLYHIPGDMPWPQDHTTMLVALDEGVQAAAQGYVPDEQLSEIVGTAVSYIHMPYWDHPITDPYGPAWDFDGLLPEVAVELQPFADGGGVLYIPEFGLYSYPNSGIFVMPPDAIAARVDISFFADYQGFGSATLYLPIPPAVVTLMNSAWDPDLQPLIPWGYVPPMLLHWVTPQDPTNATVRIWLSFVDAANNPLLGVVGVWAAWPAIPDFATAAPLLAMTGIA